MWHLESKRMEQRQELRNVFIVQYFYRAFKYDILGLAETKLADNCEITLENDSFFGQNRATHIRARCASGGVGFLIRNELLKYFNVHVLDNSVEGILWLRLSAKGDEDDLCVCVAYLPPYNSPRSEPNMFFESLNPINMDHVCWTFLLTATCAW